MKLTATRPSQRPNIQPEKWLYKPSIEQQQPQRPTDRGQAERGRREGEPPVLSETLVADPARDRRYHEARSRQTKEREQQRRKTLHIKGLGSIFPCRVRGLNEGKGPGVTPEPLCPPGYTCILGACIPNEQLTEQERSSSMGCTERPSKSLIGTVALVAVICGAGVWLWKRSND